MRADLPAWLTILILMLIGLVCRLKPTAVEIIDMDHSQHGESAYLDALENDSKYAGTYFAEVAGIDKGKKGDEEAAKANEATTGAFQPGASKPAAAAAASM